MLEALAGTGLAAAAGLNAYIPLLALGLLSRFTDFVALPSGWMWLENEWVLGIVGLLLVVEFIADKVPAVDNFNDILQTAVRPASGGIVFGSGTAAQTTAVSDPSAFFESGSWIPVAVGVAIALVVHLAKAAVRAGANAALAGLGAPALSLGEDVISVLLVVAAILLPVLVIVAVIGLAIAAFFGVRWARRRIAARRVRVAELR